MLSPEYLKNAPDKLAGLYTDVERDIIADMARRISTYDYFIPAAQHQKRMLEAAGLAEKDIIAALSKQTGKTTAELTRLFREAGAQTVRSDGAVYRAADIYRATAVDKAALNGVLQSGLKQTAGVFANLTGTTAVAGARQLAAALDSAWLGVSSGAFSSDTAIRNAVKRLAEQGLNAVTYPSGRTDSIEAAVRRAAVTGINQAALKTQLSLADQLGCDLVETTAHRGARPEHAAWQGKIFSRSGKSKKYPKFSAATGYGTVWGLGGANCRHSFYPYVDGTDPAYSREELDAYNARNVPYNGKMYTEYEASQMQRKIERDARRWKRENAAMKAAGLDASESSAMIARYNAAYRDFCRQTGMKTQRERMAVGCFGRSEAAKAAAEAKRVEKAANNYFNLGSSRENVNAYLADKAVIDKLEANGVEYIQRISADEIIVNAGKPVITGMREHAVENLNTKPDRAEMTQERAQSFVDNARLTLYQQKKGTLKFAADSGYTALNFEYEIVTAVPEKLRNKYAKYTKE